MPCPRWDSNRRHSAVLASAEKSTTKEGNVRYWLGEHLLEVYSVHQHGEGELIEKETIEMQ